MQHQLWHSFSVPPSGPSCHRAIYLSGNAGQSALTVRARIGDWIGRGHSIADAGNERVLIRSTPPLGDRSVRRQRQRNRKTPFSGKLAFTEAIQRGLDYNLGVEGVTQAMRQAQGQAKVARSALLPI